MFGEPQINSFQRTALFLASVVILAMGVYSLGMTTMNIVTNSKYSLTQSVTNRSMGAASLFGVAYFDSEGGCEEMGRPYPGMSQEERDYQQSSQERCAKRVEEQRRQVRTMDVAHSVLLLAIGGGLYIASRKK